MDKNFGRFNPYHTTKVEEFPTCRINDEVIFNPTWPVEGVEGGLTQLNILKLIVDASIQEIKEVLMLIRPEQSFDVIKMYMDVYKIKVLHQTLLYLMALEPCIVIQNGHLASTNVIFLKSFVGVKILFINEYILLEI